jgi:hypothetical protein
MEDRTTVQVPRKLLREIKRRSWAGRTNAEIIQAALHALDRQHFLEILEERYNDAHEGLDTLRQVR